MKRFCIFIAFALQMDGFGLKAEIVSTPTVGNIKDRI